MYTIYLFGKVLNKSSKLASALLRSASVTIVCFLEGLNVFNRSSSPLVAVVLSFTVVAWLGSLVDLGTVVALGVFDSGEGIPFVLFSLDLLGEIEISIFEVLL